MRRAESKYRNVKTMVDGYVFASKAEAKRYAQLKLLEKAGQIQRLQVQPRFALFAHELTVTARLKRTVARLRGGHDPVMPIKLGEYVADFSYDETILKDSENDHYQRVVEDVKGFDVPLGKWKRRHAEAQYGITVRLIK